MKKLSVLTIIVFAGIMACSGSDNDKLVPVTTSSTTALSLYRQAMKYLDAVSLDKALNTFNQALEKDPDFFMANYQLAFFFMLNRSSDQFEKYAEAAINCKEKLTDAEEILRGALTQLKEGQNNITDAGRKLVDMYPKDPFSYNNLVYYQSIAGDTTAIVETLKKAISVAPGAPTFYNQLGYAYLTMRQNDKAGEAFDKYIELDPKNPNAYDSKGDYYMIVKEYDKAYDLYMKANSIDPTFSKDKAEIAKKMYERTEGKRMDTTI